GRALDPAVDPRAHDRGVRPAQRPRRPAPRGRRRHGRRVAAAPAADGGRLPSVRPPGTMTGVTAPEPAPSAPPARRATTAGALLLGGALGFALGRRRRPTASAPGPAGGTGPAPSGSGDGASATP